MVSVSSLHSLSHHPCHYNSKSPLNKSLHLLKPNCTLNFFLSSIPSGIFRSCRKYQVICCSSSKTHQESAQQDDQFVCPGELAGEGAKRREALFKIAFSALSFPTIVSQALAATDVAENVRVYTDDENKFKISIPQDWEVGAGGDTSGFKSVTAFYPEGASSSSVSVVITGVGPDFTRLESFGKVEAFAETLVSGLDRSWQRPPGVAAKLIDCKASNGLYYIEYTLQNPGESRRLLFSALGMASNGWINRLYTITGQFVDEESEKYGSQIQKSVSSFRLISA